MYNHLAKSLFVGLFILTFLFSCSESPKPATAITVTNTDFAATQKPNSSQKFITFDKAKFTVTPTEGENQTWDFSGNKTTTAVTPNTINYVSPQVNTTFKTATYAYKYVSKVLNLDLNLTDHYEISATGYYYVGSQIQPTPVSLGNGIILTPLGNESEWTPKNLLWKFPMVYKDSYSTEKSVMKESFSLTAPPLGLNNAPTNRILSVQRKVEVIGWGKLILPSDAKVATSEVLLVKTTTTATLNYLVGGATAPVALTSALGLKEGETTTRVFYNFVSKSAGDIAVLNFDVDATGKPKFPALSASYMIK